MARLVPAAPTRDDKALERLATRGVIQRGTGKPRALPGRRPRTPAVRFRTSSSRTGG